MPTTTAVNQNQKNGSPERPNSMMQQEDALKRKLMKLLEVSQLNKTKPPISAPPPIRNSWQVSNANTPNSMPTVANIPLMVGCKCYLCRDQGWVYRDSKLGTADFGKLFRCACKINDDASGRQRRLLAIDGLTEAERAWAFNNFQLTEHNQAAYHQIATVLGRKAGFVTLTGPPGRGKTLLMMCAINLARDMGIPAVYTLTENLMEYLRAAYNPNNEAMTFDTRWKLLLSADVLAIDEIDKYHSTEWAQTKFFHLINERFRMASEKITLLATNGSLNGLSDALYSRLSASHVKVVNLAGPDIRKSLP